MVKAVGIIALVFAAFVGTLVASMGATGNLNAESINRLLGRDQEEAAPAEDLDTFGPQARALGEERKRLETWAAELEERDKRLIQRQQVLDETLTQITEAQLQVSTGLQELDDDRSERILDVAKSLAAMDDSNAAESLEEFPPEEAAFILRNIKERSRGRILDAMEARRRTLVLQIMQERKY